MSRVKRLAGLRNPPVLRKCILAVVGAFVAAAAAYIMLLGSRTEAQPDKYMTGAEWKDYLCGEEDCGDTSWFFRWNLMVQARIDQLADIVESEGWGSGTTKPFRVTMVGDSTMMQQHGVMCAFLGERAGRRFDPEEHQVECCVDTLPRAKSYRLTVRAAGRPPGGRGLCFQHAFQKFATPPDEDLLGAPDAVYFGSGLHFLHMCRPEHGLEPVRVQGWLNYEKDLEDAVRFYRQIGGDNIRLIFMTSHVIQDSKYVGDFAELLKAYRADDANVISFCEKQVPKAAGGVIGPDGYGQNVFCRQALMDRNGSEVLNRRSRPVMEKLGVPLVEADLVVKDQAWASGSQDGRHYHPLVPVEVWELMGLLVSPYP